MARCTLRVLLAVHAAVGQRWVCLPFAVLWVTGSLSVACSFAGQFAAWALLVLLADSCAAAALADSVPSRTACSAIQAGTATVVLLVTLIGWCVPIVGPAVALGTAAYIVAACSLAARTDEPRYLYYAWALAESLLGTATGYALYFTRLLYANTMDAVAPRWSWLVLLYGVNSVLGFASAVLQVMACIQISRASGRANLEVLGDETSDSFALLPVPSHQQADRSVTHASSADDEIRVKKETPTSIDKCFTCGIRTTIAWSGILLFFTVGWFATQLFPPGERWPEPPACSLNCFCKPLAGPLLNSSLHQDANNNDGVEMLPNLPFGLAVLQRQDFRQTGCNPTQSPCFGLFDHQPTVEERTTTLYLDLYRPRVRSELNQVPHRRPAIVLVHPGGFARGIKNSSIMTAEATYFAQQGFIAVTIDYRLEAASFLPEDGAVRDAIADTKAAVRWLRQNEHLYGVDTGRIAVWGASAGGIVAGMSKLSKVHVIRGECAVRSNWRKLGGVGTIGFVDNEIGLASNAGHSSEVVAAVAVSGCLWPAVLGDRDHSLLSQAKVVPYMDVHGDADVQVGTWQSTFTYVFLQSLGVPSENNRLVIVPGGGHVPWGEVERDRLRPVVMNFLIQQLRLEEAYCG